MDLDLSNDLRYKLLVEGKGFTFFVELEYEDLSEYYSRCNQMGYGFNMFRRRIMEIDGDKVHQKRLLGKSMFKLTTKGAI